MIYVHNLINFNFSLFVSFNLKTLEACQKLKYILTIYYKQHSQDLHTLFLSISLGFSIFQNEIILNY